MNDTALNLTTEERQYLVELLHTALKDTQIEEHRTRNLSYREHVVHREDIIASLLQKLGAAS
jgi:hypothetical protein